MKLLTSCSHTVFPSIRKKNHFPTYHSHYIGSVFIQEYPVFFFNCFFLKIGVSQVFSTLVLCLNLLLTEYKHSRCFFPSLKIHSLWQAINGHSDTLVTQKKKVKTMYPVYVTYQVCVCLCAHTAKSKTVKHLCLVFQKGRWSHWSHTSSCNNQISTNNQFHLAVYHSCRDFTNSLVLMW